MRILTTLRKELSIDFFKRHFIHYPRGTFLKHKMKATSLGFRVVMVLIMHSFALFDVWWGTEINGYPRTATHSHTLLYTISKAAIINHANVGDAATSIVHNTFVDEAYQENQWKSLNLNISMSLLVNLKTFCLGIVCSLLVAKFVLVVATCNYRHSCWFHVAIAHCALSVCIVYRIKPEELYTLRCGKEPLKEGEINTITLHSKQMVIKWRPDQTCTRRAAPRILGSTNTS